MSPIINSLLAGWLYADNGTSGLWVSAADIKCLAQYLLAGPPNAVGEAMYTCAVPADTIGWLVDQLDPRGDALVAAVAIADQFVLTQPLSYGDHPP